MDSTAHTRRGFIVGVFGGVAALLAQAVARPVAALAADPNDVVLGGDNVATTTTSIHNDTNANMVLDVASSDGAVAVRGTSFNGPGVRGNSTLAAGVWGNSTSGSGVVASTDTGKALEATVASTGLAISAIATGRAISAKSTTDVGVFAEGGDYGVVGSGVGGSGVLAVTNMDTRAALVARSIGHTAVLAVTDALALPAVETDTAVYGVSTVSGDGRGVLGRSTFGTGVHGYAGRTALPAPSQNVGVHGVADWDNTSQGVVGSSPAGIGVAGSSSTGTGVKATSTSGLALNVTGKVHFSRSGRVAITAGGSSKVVTVAGMTSTSKVLALLQSNRTGTYVRAAVPTTGKLTVYLNRAVTSSTYVAWFVLD